MLSLSNFLQFYLCVMVIYSHLHTSDTNIFVRLSHHFRTLGCRVILSSVWVVDRLQWCLCLSLSLSLPSVFAMLGGDDQRTGEDLVRGEEAVQMPKYCMCSSVSQPFHASHIFPPRNQAKGKEIPCLFYTLPLKGKYSLGPSRKWRGWEGRGEERKETGRQRDRQEIEFVCLHIWVFICLRIPQPVTKHDERTSVCWQIMAVLWSSRQH